MKIIKIRPVGDYDAIDFTRQYAPLKASELIQRVEGGETFNVTDGDFEMEFKIINIPESTVSPELKNFIRNEVQDYEDSKSSEYWFEDEIIETN